MKFAVVFLTFVACAVAYPHHDGTVHDDPEKEEMIKKIHEYSNACIEETGTTKDVSRKLINGDFTVQDEPAQCYVKCFFKKSGLMSEEGEIQADKLLEKLKKKKVDVDNVQELVDKCVALKSENQCEKAFRVYECYRGHVTYVHEFKEDEKKTDEKKTEEVKTPEVKTEEVKTEEVKKEETKTEEVKTEEVKAEEVKKEEVKAEEVKKDEVKTEEVKTEEVKAEEKTEEKKSE